MSYYITLRAGNTFLFVNAWNKMMDMGERGPRL